MGDFGVEALRQSPGVVGQTLKITAPSGLGRAREILATFKEDQARLAHCSGS